MFHNLSTKHQSKPNNSNEFNYYLIVGIAGHHQSAPILLNRPINRTAFGITAEEGNVSESISNQICIFSYYLLFHILQIALAASITEHNENQLYVSIYEDRFPFIEIDNRTNIDIFVAEADFADFSKSLKPKKSIHEENFQWLNSAKAFNCLNYTPPSINERFAEKPFPNVHLIFGCENRE